MIIVLCFTRMVSSILCCRRIVQTTFSILISVLLMADLSWTGMLLPLKPAIFLRSLAITCALKGSNVYCIKPWIYHQVPSEEDLYALFWKCGAKLYTRNIGTTIFIQQHLKWRRNHLRQLKKARLNGISVQRGADIAEFWPVLEEHLHQRYQSKPVHTLAEMQLLQSNFPKNIIQYNAYKDSHIVGGVTIYLSQQVVHAQYSSGNDEGMASGAMEIIYDKIMCEDYPDYAYLDLGSSTEQGCSVINEGLIGFKEGFGGRAVVYDTYEWGL